MSLYDEAAVALIAEGAAGKDGVLYNIKPEEKLKATELITEGGFENNNVDSNWSVSLGGTGTLTISNNEAVFSGVSGDNSVIFQNDILEVGKTYKVSLTIDIREGTVKIGTAGTGESNGISDGAIDTQGKHNYSFYYTVPDVGGTPERFTLGRASGPYDFTVDNVSVKEVEQKPLDFTFTRGSNLTATRVAPSGYIEKGRENLIKYSNAFDEPLADGGWGKTGDTVNNHAAIVSSGHTGYDGSSNAFKVLAEDTNNDSSGDLLCFVFQNPSPNTSGVQTFSVYAKKGNVDYIRLQVLDSPNPGAFFELTGSGTVTASEYLIDSSIEKITSGDSPWYRCSITFDRDSVSQVRIYVADGDGDDNGDGEDASTKVTEGDFIYIQNAQLEYGLVATDYIESHSTTGKAGILEDSPRFDYTGGGCPHLLMEPTRKNLFQYSEYLGGDFGVIRSTFNYNDSKSPEGFDNAVAIKETVVSPDNTHGFQYLDLSITDGTFYSFSFFVKADGREKFFCQFSDEDTLKMNVTVDLSGTPSAVDGRPGHTGSEEIIDYGDGWYRVEINGKEGLATNADGNLNFFFIEDASGTDTSYAGDTTKGLLFYGLQIEEGHYCTSYIPNHGKSGGETRNEDDTNTIDLSDYMDGEDVTLFVDLADNPLLIRDGSTSGIKLSNGTSDASSIRFYRSYENVANGGLRTMVYFANNENDGEDINVHQITESGRVKVAVRRVKSTGEFTVFYDGAQKSQDFSDKFENFDSLRIDGRNQPLFINSVIVFDRALTDDECTSLTTV